MDLSKIQWFPIACGAVVWAVAIALIWLRFRPPTSGQREDDFARWKATDGGVHATFGEFLASEQVPRIYQSRASLCIMLSAVALLALLEAMHRWAVFT